MLLDSTVGISMKALDSGKETVCCVTSNWFPNMWWWTLSCKWPNDVGRELFFKFELPSAFLTRVIALGSLAGGISGESNKVNTDELGSDLFSYWWIASPIPLDFCGFFGDKAPVEFSASFVALSDMKRKIVLRKATYDEHYLATAVISFILPGTLENG